MPTVTTSPAGSQASSMGWGRHTRSLLALSAKMRSNFSGCRNCDGSLMSCGLVNAASRALESACSSVSDGTGGGGMYFYHSCVPGGTMATKEPVEAKCWSSKITGAGLYTNRVTLPICARWTSSGLYGAGMTTMAWAKHDQKKTSASRLIGIPPDYASVLDMDTCMHTTTIEIMCTIGVTRQVRKK